MAEDSSDYQPYDLADKQLFSKQFQEEMLFRVVGVNDVVQKFVDSKSITRNENARLKENKVADSKLKYMIKVINDRCNINDLSALKSFISALEETRNIELAKQLKLIYDERENAIGIKTRLTKEKDTVENLKKEIDRLCNLLREKERELDSTREDKIRLIERSKLTEAELKAQMHITKKDLQTKIFDKEKQIENIRTELGDILMKKNDLEKEVHEKTYVIDYREKQLEEKENELQIAINESNILRLEIENLRAKYSGRVAQQTKKLSKEIEDLEEEIAKKEICIMKLRQNQTMSRTEVEEELRKIYNEQAVKLDEQAAIIKAQNDNIQQQNDKIDQLMSAVGNLVQIVSKN